MYGVKGKVTEEFITNNQSTFSIATEILLTNYILNLLTQKYPYRSCPPNYEIIFFKKAKKPVSCYLEIQYSNFLESINYCRYYLA